MTTTDDEEILRKFITVLWPLAYRTGDVELLGRLLHDSFEMVDADGNRSTKQGELDYVANNEWDPGEFEYRIERLAVYGGRFAIVAGEGVGSTYRNRSTNAVVKEAGEWRAAASHVSGVTSRGDEG